MKTNKYNRNWQELSGYENYSQQNKSNHSKKESFFICSADTHNKTNLEKFIDKYGENWREVYYGRG